MSYPTTKAEAEMQGYKLERSAKCAGCGAEIDFYRTLNHKLIPIDADASGKSFVPHWSTCPEASKFRRKK